MDWWTPAPAPASDVEEDEPAQDHHARRTSKSWTTLGHLKYLRHWDFEYYEWVYLDFIKQCLTVDWPRIQGGSSDEDLQLWKRICVMIELDKKAIADLMLLAHSGEAGRCEANEVMWILLSDLCLRDDYEDLSKVTSSLVLNARKNIDRPPNTHRDFKTWYWAKYWVPRNPKFAPSAVPLGAVVQRIEGRAPVPPPDCWVVPSDS